MFAVTRENRASHPLAGPPGGAAFGLTDAGVWFADATSLWIAPFDGGAATRVGARAPGASGLVRPAPDGSRVAYGCGPQLCLQDRAGGNPAQVDLTPRDLVWSPDGALLAAVDEHGLVIASRVGAIRYRVPFFWSTVDSHPQWTADNQYLWLAVFPNGRRIVRVTVATGALEDLTPPRWDALFALAPDGQTVLLTNGRGGFWRSALPAAAPEAPGR